jgi:hypothetical protein
MPYLKDPYLQVPIRAELEGIYYENNVKYPFKTIYDFHEFNPSLNEYTASFLEVLFSLNSQSYSVKFNYNFKTPNGVFCKNRKMIKPTPKISERYAYSEEIVRYKTILHLKVLLLN